MAGESQRKGCGYRPQGSRQWAWLETHDRGERLFELCSVPSALCSGPGAEVLTTTSLSVWQAISCFLSVGYFRSKKLGMSASDKVHAVLVILLYKMYAPYSFKQKVFIFTVSEGQESAVDELRGSGSVSHEGRSQAAGSHLQAQLEADMLPRWRRWLLAGGLSASCALGWRS